MAAAGIQLHLFSAAPKINVQFVRSLASRAKESTSFAGALGFARVSLCRLLPGRAPRASQNEKGEKGKSQIALAELLTW